MRGTLTTRGLRRRPTGERRPAAASVVMIVLALAGVAVARSVPTTAQQPAWAAATPGRVLRFPADHASHPEYRIEWWYYTGNVNAAGGRRFGYQLTFFRVGVDPSPRIRSRWAVRDLFMAHLAVTDVDGRRHRFAERLNRAGPGWAGAATDRYRVWNERWFAGLDGTRHRLRAADDGIAVDLVLDEGKPVVLEGQSAFSRKGSTEGNASHYYSLTRMPTRGTITVEGRPLTVSGSSWMDHEFGSSFLEPGQQGWDWFSIQLDDGRDLMIYRLRTTEGSADPHSSGTLVEANGQTTPIVLVPSPDMERRALVGFTLTPGRRWRSEASGASYPVEWTVKIPGAHADLRVTAAVDDQELRTTDSTGVTYWEGAIDVRGTMRGRAVTGSGYLEMTGYAGAPLSTVLR